jgi:polysaccharide export outer membrane protein
VKVSLLRGGFPEVLARPNAASIWFSSYLQTYLERDVRSITVLGAAKDVAEITFDNPSLTLSEALARSGGLSAEKADPTGVFIFRQERRGDGAVEPVIYRLNLLNPASYFAAQTFAMRQGDIMLVADARSNRLDTFLRMVNALASPLVTASVLAR